MEHQTYPFNAWVLTPTFKLKEVTIKGVYLTSSPDWLISTSGKLYHLNELHPTQPIAITMGRELLVKQKTALDKRLETINKKHAALDKAEAELKKEAQ